MIGLLSIIPGLGLVVIGEFLKGLGVFIITFLAFMCLFVPWDIFVGIGLALGLILWGVQLWYAVSVAQRLSRAEAGLALPVRQVEAASLPPGASFEEKSQQKIRDTVMGLLAPDERLNVALYGTTGVRTFTLVDLILALLGGTPLSGEKVRQCYLGITDNELILIETDAFGKPFNIQRIAFNKVLILKFREHMLSDELAIDIGEEKPLQLAVGRPLRQSTRQLVSMFSS